MTGTATSINMISGRAKLLSKLSHSKPTHIETSEYTPMRWNDACKTVYIVSPSGLLGTDSWRSEIKKMPNIAHWTIRKSSAQKKLCFGDGGGATTASCGTDV